MDFYKNSHKPSASLWESSGKCSSDHSHAAVTWDIQVEMTHDHKSARVIIILMATEVGLQKGSGGYRWDTLQSLLVEATPAFLRLNKVTEPERHAFDTL